MKYCGSAVIALAGALLISMQVSLRREPYITVAVSIQP